MDDEATLRQEYQDYLDYQEYQRSSGVPVVNSNDWNAIGSIKNLFGGAVEGAAGGLALLADINPWAPRVPVYDEATKTVRQSGPTDFPFSKQVQQALEPYLPEPDPQYRYARTLGNFMVPVPGVTKFNSAKSIGKELLMALGGAMGAQVAEDVTEDTKLAPIAGAIVGASAPSLGNDAYRATSNAYQGLKTLLMGASPAELRGSAALSMKELTGLTNDDLLLAALGPKEKLEALRTTAELTDNAGMAQLEKYLGGKPENAGAYAVRAKARTEAREEMLDAMSQTTAVNKEGLGTALMTRAADVGEQMDIEAQRLWDEVPRNVAIDVGAEQAGVIKIVNQKQAGLDLKSPVKKLVDDFVGEALDRDGLPIRTSGELQDIRSDALALARDANMSPTELRVLAVLQQNIDAAMAKGLKGQDYDLWTAARGATAKRAETFGFGTAGGALTKDSARPSNVLGSAFKGDTQAITELRAALRNDPALMEDVKRGVLDMITTDTQGVVTPDKMKKFLAANEGAIRALFGPRHLDDMQKILADLRSEASVQGLANLASKGNSVTSQRQTVAGVIEQEIAGKLTKGFGGPFGPYLQALREGAGVKDRRGVQDLLFRAAMDPEFAYALSQAPTKTRIYTALERLNSLQAGAIQAGKNAVKAGLQAGIRELSRTQESSAPQGSAKSRSEAERLSRAGSESKEAQKVAPTERAPKPETQSSTFRSHRSATPPASLSQRKQSPPAKRNTTQSGRGSPKASNSSSTDFSTRLNAALDTAEAKMEKLTTQQIEEIARSGSIEDQAKLEISVRNYMKRGLSERDAKERTINDIKLGRIALGVEKLDDDLSPLVKAVIQQESGGNAKAVSNKGAQGLMQIMPETGKEWHQRLNLPGKYDPFNKKQNITIGTAYLNWLMNQFDGDPELALTAYHTGIGTVKNLLKKHNATKLGQILPHLGPVGRRYAASVIRRIKKAETMEA